MTMNFRRALPLLLAGGLAACKKDAGSNQPAPVASFAVVGTTATDVVTVATYDDVQVTDQSTNAASYQWSLGNDSTRTTANPRFYYAKAGTYTLTQTVRNASGAQASVSKTIRVLDRVIKQVVIVDASDRVSSPPHPLTNALVWAVVRLGETHATYPFQTITNPSFNAPIIYQSPVVPLPAAASLPYAFTLPTKLVVDFPALASSYSANVKDKYAGVGYGLELYAKDATGTYLISTSYLPFYQTQAGGINGIGTDIQKNTFVATYGDIRLVGDFE